MKDKTIVIVSLLVASLMLSIAPVFAFYHPSTGLEDNKFENFGPRIDRILVKMYGTLDAEIAALQAGEIDITDWPLTKTMITTLSADPNVVVLGYGGEAGYYLIDFNNNNNQYLGNPPNPAAPNPVYQNPGSVPAFRQAVSTSINNTYLCTVLAEGLYDPIYTPMPSYMAFWIHPDIRPGGALEALTWPYDGPLFPNSNAKLDANHFPVNVGTGFRYWDRNADGVEQSDELIDLDIYTRADILRRSAGDMEAAGLTAMHIRFSRFEVDGGQAYQICMVEQNYFSYTCGWINIGPDPDYMYDLYSYESYFWDGANGPANWGAIGKYNPGQNADLLALKTASNIPDALAAARAFQIKFASEACEKPLASTAAPKAFSKYYTGGTDAAPVDPDDGENEYRGHMWDDIVNTKGFGENSWWSTLNMHPVGHEQGDGSFMTVRYGWEQTGMPVKINPIYSSWYWESELWGRVMDGGGGRNPMTLGPVEVPQLMESWSQGTWVDPADSITKATVTVTMKPDSKWSDGQPVTIDDFIYTLAILPGELVAKGCSDAWWQPTLDQIAGYYKLDDYSAIILLRSNTFLATTWIAGNVILPKHFWQPFVAANPALTIMGDLGTGLIGTGPFLYTALVAGTSATMVRNPLYYYAMPVDITMSFVATGLSVQITPNKIKPDLGGFGTGHCTLVITDTNNRAELWTAAVEETQ
jgi:ABC-type transport system substrate-binding protein